MSNLGDRRRKLDENVRFRTPNHNHKFHLPLKTPKCKRSQLTPKCNRSQLSTYPFFPGPDLSSIKKRLGARTAVAAPPAPAKKHPLEELPVYKHKAEIQRCAREGRNTSLDAETGSGKTVLVPAMICEAAPKRTNLNEPKVVVIVPRRLPASEGATFGATIRNEEVGKTIGFAHALERRTSPGSEILIATAGYEFARQIHHPLSPDQFLVVDEIHERTAAAVLLLGFYMMRKAEGLPIPIIWTLSATPNKEQLIPYLGNPEVISIQGRKYTITELAKGSSPSADTVRVLEQGKSALSFHYGVKPIEEHIAKVRAAAPEGCTILPLHSKLRREEQRAAIEPRPRKAVAATNTAQTSITIDGMDVVIITGEVRRLVLDDEGIPSLIIDQITQDEHKQQMGRVGRTGHGFVISHAKPFNELKPHAPSEIQNMSLETIILRCAAAKIPFRKLNRYLIDQAPEKHIKLGYRVLYDLGLVGPKGDITALGKSVAKLPCDARMGKLLVKASEYQETHKVAILDDAIRIAAVVESEGILSGEGRGWQRLGGKEKNSDLIKQGRVFQRAQEISPEQRDSLGIDEVNFQRACDIERMLRRKMELPETAPPRKTPEANESSMGRSLRIAEETRERLWLSRAIIEAHVDSIFRLIGRNEAGDYRYKPLTKKNQAVLQKDSVVRGAKLLIGSRFNIGFLDSDGYQRIQPLLLNAHRVDDDLLWLELATPPHLHRQNKDGIAKVLLSPQRKNERMRSRDFRKGRSHRNGKHGHGHGNA